MESSKWIRDAAKVKGVLKEQADGSMTTTRPCAIYIPKRFSEKGLAEIGIGTDIIGIFALVVDDEYYSVSNANAMMQISPDVISTVKFGDEPYLEFKFEAGSVVFRSLNLIVTDTLVYTIFDEIFAKGRSPWYLEYEDLARLFESSDHHAGLRLSQNHTALEMMAASIVRDSKDLSKYYRHVVRSYEDLKTNPPTVIPQRSIVLGATNTTTYLVGSYWEEGLSGALTNPSTELEPIEDLLTR